MFSFQTMRSIGKAVVTKRSPYYIQFYITGKCNLMCRQCNIVETNSRIPEMGLAEIRKTAKNLKRIGAGIVLLTGGEPFIRKDLPEIVDAFVSQGLNVRLQTAGTKYATDEMLEACYQAGARDINVSLDSLEFDKFDYINSVPGSARNAIETMERISKIFRKRSAILSLGTVLSKFNYKEIPSIVEFAKRIGWYISIVPVHITQSSLPKGFRSFDAQFVFGEQELKELRLVVDQLINMKKQGYPIFDAVSFLESSFSFLSGHGPTWRKNNVCDSPNLYFAIRPNGAFTTCCDYTLENPPMTYSEEFVDAYKSRQIERREDVQKIIRNCSGCHYGSYPEVTISVRDPKAFLERVLMTLNMGTGKLHGAEVKENFIQAIEDIKLNSAKAYPSSQWLEAGLTQKIESWSDSEKMKQVIIEDRKRRQNENRERGVGPDTIIRDEGFYAVKKDSKTPGEGL